MDACELSDITPCERTPGAPESPPPRGHVEDVHHTFPYGLAFEVMPGIGFGQLQF
jgi:hypothetical protein